MKKIAIITSLDYELFGDGTKFSDKEYIPIMFIAHPKTTYNVDDLHLMFQGLEKKYGDQIEYWSFQKAIDYLVPQTI